MLRTAASARIYKGKRGKDMAQPIDLFVNKLNRSILPSIDYDRLEKSYSEGPGDYTKEVLDKLHKAFMDVYGSDYVNESTGDMVIAPAVIRAEKSGNLCIGLVTLDITSSGEHWGTSFLTRFGVLDQSDKQLTPAEKEYLQATIPYDYWYTIALPRDHHVDFESAPQEVKALLDYVEAPQKEQSPGLGGIQDMMH
jgi:hypothetical protein